MNDAPSRIDPILEDRQKEFQRLHKLADQIAVASVFFLVISMAAMLFFFTVSGIGSFAFLAASLFFLISLTHLIVAQLIRIRATLERIG